MMTYIPKAHDMVRVGKHGKPMSVLAVYPISKHATVIDNDGVRHTVEWSEMTDTKWTAYVKEMNDDIERWLGDTPQDGGRSDVAS